MYIILTALCEKYILTFIFLIFVEMNVYFHNLTDYRLYVERINQINTKLGEMAAGRSKEYLERLKQLQEQMHVRIQVAGTSTHIYTEKGDHC